MAYSELLYTGDGVTTDFSVTFSYLDRSHVFVGVDKVLTSSVGAAYKFSFVNSTTVRVQKISDNSAPPAGVEVRVFRQTPIDNPAVVFGGGASLSSSNLNKNSEYLTFALQEATDDNGAFTLRYLGAFSNAPTTDNGGGTLIVGAMYFDTSNDSLHFWNGTAWKKGDLLEASIAARDAAQASQAAAVTSETNAAASEAAAAATYDNFDDRYLGAKASAPTTDNDGDPLIVGAIYFDTSIGGWRVWDGSSWLSTVYDSSSVGITGGSIDGTVIGGSTPAAISGTTGAFSGDVTLPSLNGGPLAGFRNAIINGNFDHWQRGTSGTSGYVADRWVTFRTGSTAAISQQSFTLGQTDVPNEPTHYHRVVVTSVAGAGNVVLTSQLIEGVRSFAGSTVTLSFWAKADASKNIAMDFGQDFGTGGSPSSIVGGIGVTTCALTTSWQKFTVTANIPSISGKTLGTDGNSFLQLSFWFDAGSDFNARTNSLGQQSGTFDIAQVQLEAGSVATPFERRPVGTELALCQRYFSAHTFVLASANFGGSGGAVNQISYPVRMRTTPTLSLTVPFGTGGTVVSVGERSLRQNTLHSGVVASTVTADAEL